MNSVSADTWFAAQKEERAFWDQHDRHEHANQQRFIAANLALGFRERPRSVIDFGGGPRSLLLDYPIIVKHVVDPLQLTTDEMEKYVNARVVYHQTMAENFEAKPGMFDEVWGYNCLQHVQVPGLVLQRVRALQPKKIRWFEWVDVPTSSVHPHLIDAKWLTHEIQLNAEYRQVFRTEGYHETEQYGQRFLAIVAERVT